MSTKKEKIIFTCPKHGVIKVDFVGFLCNTCDSTEMVRIDDRYVCKQCLEPGTYFECRFCKSQKVTAEIVRQ